MTSKKNHETTECVFPKVFLYILFCVFALSIKVSAQYEDLRFYHLTVEDGLSVNGVTKIFQDSDGFLWLGTYNGLNRYDGYNFKIFLPEPTNKKSISHHSIWSIAEDTQGRIWIGTLNGLNIYDKRKDEFIVYKNNPSDPNSISNSTIRCIYVDTSGDIWIGTDNGLNKYNSAKNTFAVNRKVSNRMNPDDLNTVTCITEDAEGNLWLGTWDGVTCMQKDGKIINQYFRESPDVLSYDNLRICCIYKDNAGNIWVGSNSGGLEKYDPLKKKFEHYGFIESDASSLSNNYITSISQDKFNNLWIGTKDGLNIYNPATNNFKRIFHNPEKPLSLISNEILEIKEDRTGVLWIGTNSGVSRCYISGNKFYYIQENGKNPDKSLTNNHVSAGCINRNNDIWIGTPNGLNKINNGSGKITHYLHDPISQNSLSDNYITSVLEDSRGIVWIGTANRGLNKYNQTTGEFKSYKYDLNDETSLSNIGAISLLEDHNGNIWIGTWWGLNRFDEKSEKFVRYIADTLNANCLRNNIIWIIYEDSKGMIWVGTDGGGVSMLNPQTGTFKNFIHDADSKNSISANKIFSIFESHDELMWFGTSEGLNSYNSKTKQFVIYNKQNGLPANSISGIQEDKKGNLWISTDKGLSKFDRMNEVFFNYTNRSGLKDVEFYPCVSFQSKDGLIYFASKSGLMYFNPDEIDSKYLIAPLVISDLKIFNISVPVSNASGGILPESISGAEHIYIPFHNNLITLEFALLDYYDVKKNNFSYKLAGFDTDWNEVGNRNFATYTNLPPGKFRFLVRASNSTGVITEKETSLLITILPAFYQTWWFQTLGILAVLFIAVLISQLRTKNIKKQKKLLEARVVERTKELDNTIVELSQEIIERKKAEEKVSASLEEKEVLLKEIHHRVKNNLQVISSMLYLQSASVKDRETQNMFQDSQNRIKSMALIHEKLYQTKNFTEINFSEYIKNLLENLERTFGKRQLPIKTLIHINEITLSLDTAVTCGLIVNELATNVYKYAFPPDWLNIHPPSFIPQIDLKIAKEEENQYLLTVSDNGIGLPESIDISNSQSLGLKLVYTLIAQLRGSIEKVNTAGTQFKIRFADIK